MGRRNLKASGGGVQFVSNQIGSLVTLPPPKSVADIDELHSLESKASVSVQLTGDQPMRFQGAAKGADTRAQIRRLDSLWDRNKKLMDDSQKLMSE